MERRASIADLHVVVRGRVQGVGFRYFVRERARALRIAGWVRNLPDGSVEVVARGDIGALERFRAVLSAGPPGARVAAVDERVDGPREEPLDPFAIVR